LIVGWCVAIPVPFLLMWGPSWTWILGANALLGVSQGLTWSTTVIMKVDLAGPERRGLAMGLNEFAGYGAVALSALATAWIAEETGLRPAPFYPGVVYVILGLALSILAVRETRHHAAAESNRMAGGHEDLTRRQVFVRTSLTDPNLSSVSQAGMVNNLNDGMAWGLFPLLYAQAGMDLVQIGTLAAIYPAVWGIGQLFTGAWSDSIGRKKLIVAGMWVQAGAIAIVATAHSFNGFAMGSVLLGVGTALVYPTLLAAIGDAASPTWRASSIGVYRFWRDLGYAIGAVVSGAAADVLGLPRSVLLIAALTFASGLLVWARMRVTRGALSSRVLPS
jgi:MFS family permease